MYSYHSDDYTQATPGRFVSPPAGGVYIGEDNSPYSRLDDVQSSFSGFSAGARRDWTGPNGPSGGAYHQMVDHQMPERVRAQATGPYRPLPAGGLGAAPKMRHMWAACPKTGRYRPQDTPYMRRVTPTYSAWSRQHKEGFGPSFLGTSPFTNQWLVMFFVVVVVLSLLLKASAPPSLTIILDQRPEPPAPTSSEAAA